MPCSKEVINEPLSGFLAGRPPVGEANWRDFRVLLNTWMPDPVRMSRAPGWRGLMADDAEGSQRGNRDLHDQLAGCAGYYKNTFVVSNAVIPPTQTVPLDVGATENPNQVTVSVDNSDIFISSAPDQHSRVIIRGFDDLIVVSAGKANPSAGIPSDFLVLKNNADVDETPENLGGAIYAGDEVLGDWVNAEDAGEGGTGAGPDREAINFHAQLQDACQSRLFVAGTRSRLYASTGMASNWRLLADTFLGGKPEPDDGPYDGPRWMHTQMGNYVLFTNDYDPVLAWKINDGPTCANAWSAHPIRDLLELQILSAGCIASWKGVVFIGDVVTFEGRQCSQIYWSNFNAPLDWMPGPESAAGFIDLGMGEKVLRMEPMAGQLKLYTDKAIYNIVLVGGEEVFRFIEIYRGPDTLGFRYAFANCGDSHVFVTNTSIVELELYNNTPTRTPWMHAASGVMFYGLETRLLTGYPGKFKHLSRMDTARCNQIVAGYDSQNREVWLSWPTIEASNTDLTVGRVSMTMARLYGHSSLIDHGFSSFCEFTPSLNMSVRDWMVSIGACSPEDVHKFDSIKEGTPCNVPAPPSVIPTYLIGPEERLPSPEFNRTVTPDPDSVCAIYGSSDVKMLCNTCSTPRRFSMASLEDFCIKELRTDLRMREVFVDDGKPFECNPGEIYQQRGYETLIQSESTLLGSSYEKRVTKLEVDFVHNEEQPITNLWSQIGVSAMPVCAEFWVAEPYPLDCEIVTEVPNDNDARPVGPATFKYFNTGRYVTWRLFVSSEKTDEGYDFAPLGGFIDFNRVGMTLYARSSCS